VTENYTMFLLCGFLPWLLFQETVQRSATALVEQASLIKKTMFPAEILPVTIFLSALISHLLSLPVTIFLSALISHLLSLALVMVAVVIVVRQLSLMVLLLPVYMFLLASLHVYLRDTAQVVIVMLTLWFWLTPIFISEQMYPKSVRFLLAINPLAYLVRAYRDRMLSYRPPGIHEFAVLAAFGIASFVIGGLFFRHLKRGFADVL